MLAAGHCAPTSYALWMVMGEAFDQYKSTGDKKYDVAPNYGFLAIDALGFRRGAAVTKTLLQDNGLADNKLFAEAKDGRGIQHFGPHRVDRPEQRRQRRAIGRRPRPGRRQGGLLGHGRCARRCAEDHRF